MLSIKLSNTTDYAYGQASVIFPFNFLYLSKTSEWGTASKLFRYYFYFPITDETMGILYRILRKDEAYNYDLLREYTEGYFIIPVSLNRESAEVPNLIVRSFFDRKVKNVHRGNIPNDLSSSIKLKTPAREFTMPCILCTKYADYIAGGCSFGDRSCAIQGSLRIPTTYQHTRIA